jgi:DNA-binding transcriptional MerR regulator
MSQAARAIPEKLFFKIGEVCDIADVQAHVLRYWETEFPMLAPQKNRAGQRTYRRRDVEMALRIKELLYEEKYTIAGAKNKLTNELRTFNRPKLGASDTEALLPGIAPPRIARPTSAKEAGEISRPDALPESGATGSERVALRHVARQLNEILELLDSSDAKSETS